MKTNTKVIMIMVMSLDGIVLREQGEHVTNWTSKEDQRFLKNILNTFDAVITGRKSFDGLMVDRPHYIITRENKVSSDERIKYIGGEAEDIINTITKSGAQNIALLGGPQTNTMFLEHDLVDELYITIEPKLFGKGLHLTLENKLRKNLILIDSNRINEKGTLLLHYQIDNNKGTESESSVILIPKDENEEGNEKLLEANKAFWDERAPIHEKSDFYDVNSLIKGKSSLLKYEIKEIGNVDGKDILHLQCHIGTESVSLARLGANVTGIDYSTNSIQIAQDIAKKCDLDCNFICSNVYDAKEVLGNKKFDIVYVNIGALIFLPDLKSWADIVYHCLKPNGVLYLNELHPIANVLSEYSPIFKISYFNDDIKIWDESGSYSDGVDERYKKDTKNNKLTVWDRTLGEIVSTITSTGLKLEFLHEHPGHVDKRYYYLEKNKADGLWHSPEYMPAVPGTFSLKAIKN
ncbi:hypothetical protein GCM10008908_18540 [Clostridium subterminale]|uniref:Methyltransferase domain-containing protein n=1 Tax=Clostridium subterminale TaxID=1550 RepID=A0ABN1KNW3_CLOSU